MWHQFARQAIPGVYNIYSLRVSIATFAVMAVVFIVGGVLFLLDANAQVEVRARYDELGPMAALTRAQREAALQQPGAPAA